MAFATILAVVAGLVLTSSASVAHDIYNVVKKGTATEQQEIRMTRIAAAVIGAVAIRGPSPRRTLNIAFLVALAFAVAASATAGDRLQHVRRRFSTRGAVWASRRADRRWGW